MNGSGNDAGRTPLRDAVLIAGPTASGKSALALEVARREGGIVVNADSMQVYSTLSVITARPGRQEMAEAEHRLYGHVRPDRAYSTGAWLREVRALIEEGAFRDRRPIFVGGTGLYFRGLIDGLAPMPAVAPEIRARWRERLANEGAERLHAELAERDPQTAAALVPGDGQRLVRALEVLDASGRSIRDWQGASGERLVDPSSARMIVLEPAREAVVARIEARFERMVEEGALDEVSALLALDLPSSLPAMKAIGVPELAAHLRGEIALDEAIAKAKAATRRYAKRQVTWLRHQMDHRWRRLETLPGDGRAGSYRRFCEITTKM